MAKTNSTAAPQEAVFGRRTVPLTNQSKVLYPQAGFTKGDVVRYYRAIVPTILPHLAKRPVTLKRYPNGVDDKFFYEKRCPSHRPEWVKTAAAPREREEEDINYCVVSDEATLTWLANLACLELHPLLWKAGKSRAPTTMVFDLDPGPPAGMAECVRVALVMRDTLDRMGLKSFPKTSGGKGLHLWVPLNTPATFDQTKQFAQAFALLFEKQDPSHVISVMRKDLREGKVLIDWSQNDEHKTTVAAYSLRARAQPTVSTPVTWDEVESSTRKKKTQLAFTADEVLARVQKLGDLFAEVQTLKQRLPKLG